MPQGVRVRLPPLAMVPDGGRQEASASFLEFQPPRGSEFHTSLQFDAFGLDKVKMPPYSERGSSRYVREWDSLISYARERKLPWITSARSDVQGAIP